MDAMQTQSNLQKGKLLTSLNKPADEKGYQINRDEPTATKVPVNDQGDVITIEGGNDPLIKGIYKGDFSVWAKVPANVFSDKVSNEFKLNDGFDSCRDLVSVSTYEGPKNSPYSFLIKVRDLYYAAEETNLNIHLLLNFGDKNGSLELPDNLEGKPANPWKVGICLYDVVQQKVLFNDGKVFPDGVKAISYDSEKDGIQFALDKEALRQSGWHDGQSLDVDVITSKDFYKQITDEMKFSIPEKNKPEESKKFHLGNSGYLITK